ncbi:hypothetical protein [Ruminococcus sp.]|uniref:spore cortex biosynthesis protein YabQ n=1 Tax=Ruminococcus sp. TaxID=41978 RepID=UPI0025CBF29C|nr:hypothetical protein [Ruminococcus sp.]MBQ8967074.1 hypothetical protein [Ruminococcus sp.]
MSIFEAAAEFGALPSGVVLGLILGVLSLIYGAFRRHIRFRAAGFLGDMLWVISCAFCVFVLGVGMEGQLRYPTLFGSLLGTTSLFLIHNYWH